MGNKVVHFEVTGKDATKLQDFYSRLFDWKVNADNPMNYGVVDTGAGEGAIGGGIGGSEGDDGLVTFYVSVDDPEAYLKKAEELGGRTVVGVTEIPNMVTFALFADPEGHVVGIVKDAS
jgi:hypothetical protein